MNLTIESGIELNDGRFIPRLAFGTFDLADGDEATVAVTCAIEAGYRHIDCARFYGNEKGVGAALAASGVPRDELFIVSKVWNDRQIDGTVRESVEESLRDLQLDHLDLLLIHWPVAGKFAGTWRICDVAYAKMEEAAARGAYTSSFNSFYYGKMKQSEASVRKGDLLFCGAPHLFVAHVKAAGKWADDYAVNCNLATAYFELLANAHELGTVIMSYSADVLRELDYCARFGT